MTASGPTLADDSVRFPSLELLRAAHTELLKEFRGTGSTSEMNAKIEAFIRRGKATGALLDADADRWAAQSQLDYWGTQLYRPDYEPPDATLDEFDPALAPEIKDELCPYVGLDAFRELNQSLFFGRIHLVQDLIKKLEDVRFMVVVGSSGSGKSSVVRAGLIPALKSGALPGSEGWKYFTPMVPGSNPLTNLGRLLMPSDVGVAQLEQETGFYQQDSDYLATVVAERFRDNVVLVVDQFEEIFTLCNDETARQRFVENLRSLCQVQSAEHRVIITMRSDFEANVAKLPELQAIFEQSAVRVTPLNAAELREAIETPAAKIGLKFEEGVVDALLSDTLGEPAALPLLQFTLLKLWEKRERNRITWEAYRKLGSGREALARSADDFYNRLIPEDQVALRRILLRMVKFSEGLEVTSNRVRRVALYQKAEAKDRIDRVLEKLIQARLVRVSEGDIAADEQVEMAHEALMRNWPRLVEWLEEERVSKRQRQRLTIAAEEWQRLGRASSALLRGELLNEAERYDDLNELENEFVEASHEAEHAEAERAVNEARQQRELEYTKQLAEAEKLRAEEQAQSAAELRRGRASLIVALVVAVLLAIIAGVFGVTNSNLAETNASIAETSEAAGAFAMTQQVLAEANAAEAQRLANIALARQIVAQAQSLNAFRSSDQMVAGLLVVESMRVFPTGDAAQFLLNNNFATHLIASMTHDETLISVAFSPDGKYVLSAGRRNDTARVWEAATGKELTRKKTAAILSLAAFSPDGRYVVSTAGKTVEVWEAATGKIVASKKHDSLVSAITFSPDGKYVASASFDSGYGGGSLRVWPIAAGGEEIWLIKDRPVYTVAFSPDGKYLAAGVGRTLFIWEVATGKEIIQLRANFAIVSLSFSPDGLSIVSASCDRPPTPARSCDRGFVEVWDISSGEREAFARHDNFLASVAFSPNGRYVLSGGENTARVWDAKSGSTIARMVHDGDVTALAFSPDGNYVVSGSADNTARVWETTTGKEVARMLHRGYVSSVSFSPDGNYVVSGSRDRTARVWRALADKEVARIVYGPPSSVTFTADGKYVVAVSDPNAGVWEADTGKLVAEISMEQTIIPSLALSPDGKYIVTSSAHGAARVWAVPSGKEVSYINGEGDVFSVDFSPDGKYVASASGNIVSLWEATTGRVITRLTHNSSVFSVVFSPDGKYLVASDSRTERVWDVKTGKEIAHTGISVFGNTIDEISGSVLFSPDGQHVLSIGSGSSRLWEAATGKEIIDLGSVGEPVAFSPNGKFVLSGVGRTARVLEALTGKETARVSHEDTVTSVTFSLDGNYAVSGSQDHTVRVWQTATGIEVARMIHDSNITSVAFSPDGRYIASGSEDGTIRVWMWKSNDLKANFCASATRNLTVDEWMQYFPDQEYRKTCEQWSKDFAYYRAIAEEILSESKTTKGFQLALDRVKTEMKMDSAIKDADAESYEMVEGIVIAEIRNSYLSDMKEALRLIDEAKDTNLRLDPLLTDTDFLDDLCWNGSLEDYAARVLEYCERAVALAPDEPAYRYSRALASAILGKPLDQSLDNADSLNELCWDGSLHGYAAQILEYCERAVTLAPNDAAIRDSRGLARALTGDYLGAIEDFQFFIDHTELDVSKIQQRKQWIIDLKSGKNPFTPEALELLR